MEDFDFGAVAIAWLAKHLEKMEPDMADDKHPPDALCRILGDEPEGGLRMKALSKQINRKAFVKEDPRFEDKRLRDAAHTALNAMILFERRLVLGKAVADAPQLKLCRGGKVVQPRVRD